MPIYTYRCESCGVQFERHQFFHEDPLKTCPECRKKTLRKVIAPVGIVFKGSGFYATDHKSPSGQTSRENKKEKEMPAGETKDKKTPAPETPEKQTPAKEKAD